MLIEFWRTQWRNSFQESFKIELTCAPILEIGFSYFILKKLKCENICDRLLLCGSHRCESSCHDQNEPCPPCTFTVDVECNCGRSTKTVPCADKDKVYSCGTVCGKLLSCGNHNCDLVCHSGDCGECKLSPSVVKSCFCGEQEITPEERSSCLDPIPSCGSICAKELVCGHKCPAICHPGPDCPPCPQQIEVSCLCQREEVTVNCGEYYLDATVARCERQCKKKMSCGRHTCPIICCPGNIAIYN